MKGKSENKQKTIGIQSEDRIASELPKNPGHFQHYMFAVIAIWTVVATISLWWNLYQQKQETIEVALTWSRASFDKDLLYRRWNAEHGGVYAPATEKTEPNLYLSHLSERDIITHSGKKLTLINPAYMTRQVHELARERTGVQGHITSLKPIRPENAPDQWETKALQAFEQGVKEVSSIEDIEGEPYMRLMRPLLTEKGCLKCHATQGYKMGDIRGGISVSIPMRPLWLSARKSVIANWTGHGILWALGIVIIWWGSQQLLRKTTALQKNQEELIKQNNELTKLFRQIEIAKIEWENTMDCIGDMVILTDREEKIKRCNNALAKFTSMPYQKIIGSDWIELLHEHGIAVSTFYGKSIELFQNSTGRWFQLNSYPVKDINGVEDSGKVITIHNSTELKKITEELERKNREIDNSRKELQNALNQISTLMQNVINQTDTSIRLTNPKLKKCYEMKKCTKEDCVCYGKEITRCWQEAGTFCGGEVQGAFAKKYGTCLKCEVFKEATSEPIFQIGEQFNNMMHVLEVKSKELEKAYKELKSTQSRLLQQEKMASIGQLAAGVAHEINNPMGYITSNIGTLNKHSEALAEFIRDITETAEKFNDEDWAVKLKEKRKQLDIDYILEDTEPLIRESLDGTERVKKIVQNLKSFSRVDQTEYKHANLNECIESTLNIIWNELKYRTTVEKEYGNIPLTKCYPQQLNQVFMNLLINAAQAIEKQGTIKIKTWNGDGMINISISDTGCGIPEEKINKIFEPFFTTKEVGKGTGLGLSICYDIVEKHHGEIRVDSEVGKGTIFHISIPVAE